MSSDLGRIALLILVCLVLGGSVFFVLDKMALKQNSQADFSHQLARVSRTNCLEIEALKTNVRLQAISNRADLQKNARLLGIKVTPALIRQENIDTNKILKTYAPRAC